ncbi:ATPase [Arenibacter sp. F20364]|uniref:AAA family ATPase n=1 Tax=Arenibacter sp. F20364 TaxID=2926415 RepID=UPI001FF0EEE4|nr:ATPase [Arenibacter sp. F20364]MCK0192755.1 ATPase [Arenibacter sp. F20364]
MNPIYLDTHIHTSANPNQVNEDYDIDLLVKKIHEFNGNSDFLISLTDHNMVNKSAYLKAVALSLNIILGVELHIRNYDNCPAYHCHIYFDLKEITGDILDDINKKLDELYPKKEVEKRDPTIPTIQEIINKFDSYEFMLLPHGGQSHATFNTSIPKDTKLDSTLERNVYYNHFEGFTARGDKGLEKTQDYFQRLGINEFVNLITCSDNYTPTTYPNGKDKNPFNPTWMLAEPTFNGLRLSLSEQSRLIYSAIKPTFYSENIQSVSHKQDNIEIDIELTSGLNVIIGGSSSGKTLLVDSIVRCLNKDTEDSIYQQYGVDKFTIVNPSGMKPHYLSQNYIMGVVNNISEDKIENIDIIKRAFPGDDDIKTSINNGLREFKKNILSLISSVKVLEEESQTLQTIPILSRLITRENLETNIYDNLQSSELENEKLRFSQGLYDEYVNSLETIDNFLSKYPFITHDSDLVDKLKTELTDVLNISNKEKQVRNLLESEQESYNQVLRHSNSEEQTKRQSFNKLLISLKKYVRAYRKFHRTINSISSYTLNFDSEEIESMGHKLYIENDFILSTDKFIEVVNHFLKNKITSFENITPELLYESNFKKQKPKVHDYDDFENRIYNSFEELNKKKYKIITNDGREFDKLSPGWKTSVILDIILGYDKDSAPIIIDQPEDNLATDYINKGLVTAVKKIKSKKQIILVSHNATIPMLADAQNIILCRNDNNKLIIKSSPLEGEIEGTSVVDLIAKITDGGKSSIKKRVKKYNLKKFSE